jgi:hypothetical protein
MILASAIFTFTSGLLVALLGFGVLANVLIRHRVVQVFGERQQNEKYPSRASEG